MVVSECHTNYFCLLYFDSASEDDSTGLRQTFHRSLLAILGGTEHSCRRSMGEARAAVRTVCRTRERKAH